MIEQVFRNLVDSKTTWTVYLNRAIENIEPPYVIVKKISAPRLYTHDGRSGMVESTFQVDLYHTDYKTVKEEAFKLYDCGDYTSETVSSVMLVNETDLFETLGYHHIVLDFLVRNYE
jgi:hypothetical protein